MGQSCCSLSHTYDPNDPASRRLAETSNVRFADDSPLPAYDAPLVDFAVANGALRCSDYYRGREGFFYCPGSRRCTTASPQIWGGAFIDVPEDKVMFLLPGGTQQQQQQQISNLREGNNNNSYVGPLSPPAGGGRHHHGGGTDTSSIQQQDFAAAGMIQQNSTVSPQEGNSNNDNNINNSATRTPNGPLVRTHTKCAIFTADSCPCTAARHAGLINDEQGGVFFICTLPGQIGYLGGERHNLVSMSSGLYDLSFAVAGAVYEN